MNWKVSSVGISVIYHSRLCWNSDSERSNDILRWRGALWFSTAILMFSPTESDTADFLNTAFPIMNYDTARLVGQIAFLPCLGNLMPIILVWIQARLPRYLPKQSKHVWYQNKRSKQARCEKALNGWFLVRICCSVDQTLSIKSMHARVTWLNLAASIQKLMQKTGTGDTSLNLCIEYSFCPACANNKTGHQRKMRLVWPAFSVRISSDYHNA